MTTTPNSGQDNRARIENNSKFDFSNQNILVIIPAFNEARLIGSVILKIKQFVNEIVVVNDGSTDDTAEIALAAGAEVITLENNQGKGAALNAGLDYARSKNPEAIVIIDADGQHLPEELNRIVSPIVQNQADITIGSRYIANTSNTPTHRKVGHKFLNSITGMISGIRVSDSQSGYRAFSPKAYQVLRFNSTGFSVESEMQFLASEHGLIILDVPITIQYLEKEKRSAWKQGVTVLNGIISLTGQYRPLLFFGVPGIISLAIGVIWGLIVINQYIKLGQLAIGYAMICVLLCLFGLTLFSTGITLHSIRALFIEHLSNKRNISLEKSSKSK